MAEGGTTIKAICNLPPIKEDVEPSSIIDPDSTNVFYGDAMVTLNLYDDAFGPTNPTAFFVLDGNDTV